MTSTAAPSLSSRDNNFLFLRILLASAVIVCHTQIVWEGNNDLDMVRHLFHGITLGEIAVDGFFILSGFLITQSYLQNPQPFAFLWKRTLRICPGFLACTLVSGFIMAALRADWHAALAMPPGKFLSDFISQCFNYPDIVLPNGKPRNWNPPMWTIPYEFMCYIGALCLGMTGVLRKRWLVPLLLVAVFLSKYFVPFLPGIREVVFGVDYYIPSSRRFTQFFLAGSCAFLYWDRIRFTRRGFLVAWLVFAAAIIWGRWLGFLLPLPGAYLLLGAAYQKWPALNWFKRAPDFSYGTYLYGWPVGLAMLCFFPGLPYLVSLFFTLLLSYTCGLLSWYGLEKRSVKLGHKLAVERKPAAVPA